MPTITTERARKVFRAHGGTLRTTEAIVAGIHPRTLYAMRDAGEIEALARGVFRIGGLPPLGNPDLATVAKRIPHGAVCLISALSFHELTTQVRGSSGDLAHGAAAAAGLSAAARLPLLGDGI